MRFRFLLVALFALVLSLGIGFHIRRIQAGELVGVAVRLTRQAVATSTNVELAFTSPNGVHLPTDDISIRFPDGFDINAIVHTDVTLLYGPTTGYEVSTAIASAPGLNVWGFQRGGQTIVLTPPTNAGVDTIPSGSRVTLRIGTWGGGTHRIVTPSLPGIYEVRVSGEFDDDGRGYVQIWPEDGLGVTVKVTAAGGGGPPGGSPGGGGLIVGGGESPPPPFDGVPPVIVSLVATDLTDVSARILLTTDEPADVFLEYGRTAADYSLGTRVRTDRRTTHEFLLEGLSPETEYHLRVRARDAMGNTRIHPDFTFRTLAAPTTLTISGIEVTFVDDQQAMIRWTTSADVLSGVVIGTPPGTRTIMGSAAGRNQVVTITGLSPATFYPFQIVATPSPGPSITVPGPGFTTLSDRTPPGNVRNFRGVFTASPRGIELTWVNPEDPDFSKTQITRMSSDAAGSDVFICLTPETRCTDTPPAGETSFLYRAVAFDASGNPSTGALVRVTLTAADELVVGEPAVPRSDDEPTPIIPPTPPRPGGGDTEGSLPPILTPRPTPDAGSGAGTVASSTVPIEETNGGVTSTDPIIIPGATPDEATDPGSLSGEERLELAPRFFLSATVPATPDRAGVRSALVGRSIQVQIPVTELPTSLTQAQLQTSGGFIYQFAYREQLGAFVSDFTLEAAQGVDQFVQIQAVAADGRRWEGRFPFRMIMPARVTDVSERSRVAIVAGAVIEALSVDSASVVARFTADTDGRYAGVLANGRYRLRVTKDGFRPYEQTIQIENGILARDIELRRTVRSIAEIINPEAPLRENVAALASEAVLAAEIGLEIARSPEVQGVTREVVAPVVVVATVGTTATAVSGFTLANYLRFLFTQPLLLIRRRKRKSWGVVYNALSKQPVELAIVRLLKAGTSFAIQTRITDAQGRFSFFVPPGSYTIQVQKPGYTYPTTYLKDERTDVDFVDLYHGEELKVTQIATISPNIPLDPVLKEETPKAITRKRYWRKMQSILGVGGIFVSLGAIVISPTLPMIGFALFQVASYAVFRRLAIPPAPKRWGIVYDSDGKHPLAKAVVRIFDKKFNKLLETQITSKDGTYGFFVAKGRYYLTAEKPGYERYLSADLDLTQAKDTYIDHRFALKQATVAPK